MKKNRYDKNLILLYNELIRHKIYDKGRCTLCKQCIHSKIYKEDTELFTKLKRRLGEFYQCHNIKTTSLSTIKNNCSYYVKE